MKLSLILILFVLINSCSDPMEGVDLPDDLIPRDTLVMVLKELTLIETHIQNEYKHVAIFKETMELSGKKILDKYHIAHNRFEESMDYYGSRQEQMTSIYTEILDSLNKDASLLVKNGGVIDSNQLNVQPNRMGFKPRI